MSMKSLFFLSLFYIGLTQLSASLFSGGVGFMVLLMLCSIDDRKKFIFENKKFNLKNPLEGIRLRNLRSEAKI